MKCPKCGAKMESKIAESEDGKLLGGIAGATAGLMLGGPLGAGIGFFLAKTAGGVVGSKLFGDVFTYCPKCGYVE